MQVQQRVINGLGVRVDDIGPRSAPVVLLSNSLAADLSMWDDQAAKLAQSYRVLRLDTRGHGGTEATEGDYSLDLLGTDVLGLMDMLEIGRVHFIGLSLGGMIGQHLAQRAPERLASLTLCATFSRAPFDMWDERARLARSGGFDSLIEPTLERWLTPRCHAEHPEVVDRVRRMIAGTSPVGYAGCACAIRDMRIDDAVERIGVPTLVVAAEQDPSSTLDSMIELHRRIPGAKFARIADASHLFTMERPQEATRILAGFLETTCGEARGKKIV